MNIYQGIDAYLQNVDMNFCSNSCPCLIKNGLDYTLNSTANQYYQTWVTTDESYGANTFRQCPGIVKNNAYTRTVLENPNFDSKNDFNENSFFDYFQRIEEQFSCSGWCRNTYLNANLNSQTTIYKYLFSGLTR
jgi:hypothetical protein